MSIDLEWGKLDSSLSSHLVDVLNRQLTNTVRPSFIGPIEVTSLDFGSDPPDVELIDLRDIYRDFLEDDDDDLEREPVKVSEGAEDDDGFEWVSRRATSREAGRAFEHLPPHVRHGYGRGGPADTSAPTSPHSPMDIWNAGMGLPSLVNLGPASTSWPNSPLYRSPSPTTPFSTPITPPLERRESSLIIPSTDNANTDPSQSHVEHEPPPPPPPPNGLPNLQLHLHVTWHSNLRITLTTSLLINYPSPMFMSLPIKLSVTGLLFTGELAVAYEGERQRVHLCILDDLDPYGPAGDRPKRDSASSTPPELDEDSAASGVPPRLSKPLPIGRRLLPSIYIESEIGQADKHVLKNVTRVERFIQDVIRQTVEEELVFPNFHTLVMGEQ